MSGKPVTSYRTSKATVVCEPAMREEYVIVTITDDGIVHCYGDRDGPFKTQSQAEVVVNRMREADRRMYPNGGEVFMKVCKVLTGLSSV